MVLKMLTRGEHEWQYLAQRVIKLPTTRDDIRASQEPVLCTDTGSITLTIMIP